MSERSPYMVPVTPARPLKVVEVEIEYSGSLSGALARTLVRHADKRGRQPVDVLADIVEIALREDMVDAILDDGR